MKIPPDIVGCAQLVQRDKFSGLQYPVPHLLLTFNYRIKHVNNSYKCASGYVLSVALWFATPLACHLAHLPVAGKKLPTFKVNSAGIRPACQSTIGAMGGVVIAARQTCTPNFLLFFLCYAAIKYLVIEVDEIFFKTPPDGSSLSERRPSMRKIHFGLCMLPVPSSFLYPFHISLTRS